MPRTMDSPANIMNAVDYFKAKLQFENTPHGLRAIMNLPTVLIVDVRDRESYEKEHIKGAVNIPLDELPKRVNELPKEKTIVCYCWRITCAMAPKACLELAHRDYKVQELVGGIESWKNGGFEVEGTGGPTIGETDPSSPKQELQREGRKHGGSGKPDPSRYGEAQY